MQVVGMLTWWYSGGIRWLFGRIGRRVMGIVDFFSIDLLLKTLFSPFRQIDAGVTGRSLEAKFRAFIDRLISRLIGFLARSFMIIFGTMSLLFVAVCAVVAAVLWLVLPLLPIVGLTLFLSGWMPWPSL
jgi:hypothetical protein